MDTAAFSDPARALTTPPSRLLHDFLAAAVARDPAAPAIDVPPGRDRPDRQVISYGDLDALATRLARHLAPRIHGEAIVALLIERASPLLYATQIGVLRAGGAFTCLDPVFPDDRMADILDDAAPVAVLADAAGIERLARLGLDPALICDVAQLAATEPAAVDLPAALAPSRLAYVIYTSGTTGRPKGVEIEHRAIANLVAGDLAEFGLGPGDRVVQGSSTAYDSSLEEIWLALASGATLVVMDDRAARAGPDVIGWLQAERASVFCPPPTLLRSSGCADPVAALPDLRLLYVGGEALAQDLADLWARGRRMVNGYGPTECAVTCLRCDVIPGQPVGIGRAVPGMTAVVLDEAGQPVAPGVQGELAMGGAGLARGYRRRADLTAEKFIDHPVFGRLYRTGDLVECGADGVIYYHGRIDAQVKIRGYRVELGEIEARLAAEPGVRAAAVRIQQRGAAADLVGFVVPADPAQVPDGDALRASLARQVPAYMVPVQIAPIAALPTTVGGKLDRARLPELTLAASAGTRPVIAPAGTLETLIADAVGSVLHRDGTVSVADDFFADLGGDSLSAALLVTLLRDDPRTQWVTVSDIYEARTVRALAQAAHALVEGDGVRPAELDQPREGVARPALATVVQVLWLAVELTVGGWVGWAMAFRLFPLVYARLGVVGLVAVGPLLALASLAVYLPLAVGLAVAAKRVLIGRYRPIRAPVWSAWYLRHWIVLAVARLIPWPLIAGSQVQLAVLRALGARIGQGVHIHRGVDLARGGWDLLDIGDHVAIGQDAIIGLTQLDRGDLVVGPVVIESGATLLTRATVGGWCRVGAGSELTALSSLNSGQVIPAGERWAGVPARAVGPAPLAQAAPGDALPARLWDLIVVIGEAGLSLAALVPVQILALGLCWLTGTRSSDLWYWAQHPALFTRTGLVVIALTMGSVPVTLVTTALLMRLIGRVQPGTVSRWSAAYARAWLKAGLLRVSGEWLTGTLFWPRWLRLAGMAVGAKCEISTIIDVVPELVTIGPETFFADGIYLGGGTVRRGTVELGHTRLGRATFLGNHVVVPPGEHLPDDILIGIATPAAAAEITAHHARFGHPAFDLPRREIVEVDRSLTLDPSPIRYASRLFWELARFALPLLPLLLTVLWYRLLALGDGAVSPLVFALGVIPLAALVPLVALCLGVLVLKWLLIGRARPGQHPLWSCWCSRWDYLYVAWARWAAPVLRRLEGTLLLPVYLRAMGLKIGRRAVLGPQFAQIVDPDMIEIGDGATVSAFFQAHTFEDRVLKTDRVVIGAGATLAPATVPLYGAVIDARTHVGAGSVIMKREHLLPGLRYQGVPTRVAGEEAPMS